MIRPLRAVTLDLSTSATAVAATHDPAGDPFLNVFTIPGTAGRPLHEQCAAIEYVVRRACGYRAGVGTLWVPGVVTVEGTFSRTAGPAQDYALHHLHANIKQWLWRRSIPYVDVANTTLKVWMVGRGRGVTKRESTAAVVAAYGRFLHINPADDNQADAAALLAMTLHAYGQPLCDPPYLPGKPNSHLRALKGIEWPSVRLAAN